MERIEKLTPSQWIVLRNIWSLTEEDKAKLHTYSYKKLTLKSFLEYVDTEHAFKDFLTVDGRKYELSYMETCFSHLEELSSTKEENYYLLIALRVIKGYDTAIAIVRPTQPAMDLSIYKELVL